ncbi:GvpL/GvpF family gas vesicle protein [Streptodolium elevatio]|uniref:GvpL/GvpF family gas vesicle protein n=1 Tax=Streptodolium elevatio TaxID=3157996 RepID=A0ABV3DTX7_9ACTN
MTSADGRLTAVYAYAVCRPFETDALSDVKGVGGGQLRTLAVSGSSDGNATDHEDLWAVVETVPAADFGEESLHRRFEALPELEQLARAHHTVVQTLGAVTATAPLRLATLYYDDDGVRTVLRREAEQLRAALDHIAGRAEWGIKAYASPPPRATGRPVPAPPSELGPGSGREYLRRRKAERTSAQDARDVLDRAVTELDAALSAVAVDVHHLPPRLAAAPDRSDTPGLSAPTHEDVNLLNAAYLVADDDAAEFASVVDLRAHALPLRIEVTGPWAPYSFTPRDLGSGRSGPGDERTESADPGAPPKSRS